MKKTMLEKELGKTFGAKKLPPNLWIVLHVLKLKGAAIHRLTGILPQTISLYKNGMPLSEKHSQLLDQLIEDAYPIIEKFLNRSFGSRYAYGKLVLNTIEAHKKEKKQMSDTISFCDICNRPFRGTGVCEVCYTMMEQATLKTDEPVEEPVTLQLTKTQYEALAKLLDILNSDEIKSIAGFFK